MEPGEVKKIDFNLIAPNKIDKHLVSWRMCYPLEVGSSDIKHFGPRISF